MKVAIALLLVTLTLSSFSQDTLTFPVPHGNPNQLFYLQRTPNPNTIVCELNYKNGVLNLDEPVHVYWIRYGEKGQKAELNYLQRTFAYGVKTKRVADSDYELYFVSYKKYKMHLRKGTDSKFYVFTSINNRNAVLKSVFIKINGGSFWSPNVEYVELKGIDAATGTEVAERMKI